MALDEGLFQSTIDLGIDLERVSKHARKLVIDLLIKMERELIAKVAAGDFTDISKARMAKQMSEADAIIRRYYDQASGISIDTTTTVAQIANTATAQALGIAVGGQIAMPLLPTETYLNELATQSIIQGATQKDFWAKAEGDAAFKFQAAVRQGLVAGETNQAIIKRVRVAMSVNRATAETLVRTSVQTVSSNAREASFQAHDDIIKALEYNSALDSRTCVVCGGQDGKRWTLDGNPINGSGSTKPKIPQHWNCRCAWVPVLKTWNELGIDAPDFPESTRASQGGQIEDTTWENYIAGKSTVFQDEALGKGRAKLFRDGIISLNQMVDGVQPMSLEKLRAKYL